MENVKHRLTLDLLSPDEMPCIEAQRGETARTLIIGLTQRGRPYWIDEGVTAVFYARKSDGVPLFNACVIEENTIRYEFTGQTTNVTGIVECEIELYSGDTKLLVSPRFEILVEERIAQDGDIPDSNPEYTALTELVAQGTALINDLANIKAALEPIRDEAVEAAERAEEAAEDAATSAQQAQSAKEAAEKAHGMSVSAAVRAQQCMEQAALSAQAADVSAQLAEAAQEAAEGSAQTAANDAMRAQQCMERAALSAQAADVSAQLAESAQTAAADSEAAAVTAAGDAQVQAETAAGYTLRAEAAAKRAEDAAAGMGQGGGGLTVTDDGNGNIAITGGGTSSLTDDGNGNLTFM